jgi:hypothetical protein
MKKLFLILITILFAKLLIAQVYNPVYSEKLGGFIVQAVIVDGDTMPYTVLPVFHIISKRSYKDKKAEIKYSRLVRNVKTVYPFAVFAREKLAYYENLIAKNPAKKDSLMKAAEKSIEKELKPQLEELTYAQGHILLKLIDRETNRTSYQLVKDLRSKTRAFFYQGFARLFGFNLKKEYEADGSDYEIEQIVRYLEGEVVRKQQGENL